MNRKDHQPKTMMERIQRAVNVMVMNENITVSRDTTSQDVARRIFKSLGEPERVFTLDGNSLLVWRTDT